MPIAIITGGSRGLGRALSQELVVRGWSIVIDGRDKALLADTAGELVRVSGEQGHVIAISGDVRDVLHREALLAAARTLGQLDLVVNNASTLGVAPLPHLSAYPIDQLLMAFETNVIAPLALIQASLESLRSSAKPTVINITSDAAVEPYEGWGGYGSTKAALDQLTAVLALEEPSLRVWSVDPGDMRTEMHQSAYPKEDISDRQDPGVVAIQLLSLIESDLPSGRYRASEVETTNGQER